MGCVLEQQAFEHRTGHPLLLGRELAHGLELQAQIIVRPTLVFSRLALLKVMDTACIEGVVTGLPRAIGRLSEQLRRVQDGQVSHYLAWMGGGAVVLLAVLLIGK